MSLITVPPRVAIVYLTYNGPDSERDITRCFETITKINYPLEQLEVICVENPSKHGASWPFIERDWRPREGKDFPKLTIEKNEKDLGYSGACNIGARIADEHGCDYAYLLNQDADTDPDFIKAAVERAESDPQIGFVQSLILLGDNKEEVNSIGNEYHFLGYGYSGGYHWSKKRALAHLDVERETNPRLEVPYYSGAGVLVRLSMMRKIGLYDTPFYMYHEDVDASFNARVHGYHVVIEPKSIIYHYYAFSRSIKKFYWIERNRYLVMLSYYKLATWLLILPAFLVVEIGSFLFSIKSGWWRERLRAYAFYLRPSTWEWVRIRRKRIQTERMVNDRGLLALAESRILFQEGTQENTQVGSTGVSGFLVQGIANPLLTLYWNVVYALIRW